MPYLMEDFRFGIGPVWFDGVAYILLAVGADGVCLLVTRDTGRTFRVPSCQVHVIGE